MQVSKHLPAINELIEKLEEAGFTCSMSHHRDVVFYNPETGSAVDALTIFSICWEEYDSEADSTFPVGYDGVALCSVQDEFSPVIGAKIAFNRALEQMSGDLGRGYMKEILA